MSKSKAAIVFFSLLNLLVVQSQNNLSSFVNPMIGTGGHGHTFPGAVWPFGMVQLSPDTRVDGSWDGCSGYHYSDKKIYGFSHTHLSGTGCSDWGDILLLPCAGEVPQHNQEYASGFSHNREEARAGYYRVELDKYQVNAELTVSPRVGIHRYTYKRNASAKVLIDLLHRDKTLESGLTWIDSTTLCGYRISQAWAKRQVLYFAVKFSVPVKQASLSEKASWKYWNGREMPIMEKALLEFDLGKGKELMVKVALSSVSEASALNNLNAEAPHWNFERYRMEAESAWDKQLAKIVIAEKNKEKKTIFYSALYHCCIHPSLYSDVDGRYRGRDDKIQHTDHPVYSVYSLWDTYRALHPLLCLIEPERTSDFLRSMLLQYRQSGRLPVWELSSNETDCMIGFHSVSVIADAYLKGIRDFDTTLALEAMVAASNYSAFGIPVFNEKGFLQVDDENESVSKSLEYAYDNWCIGRMAESMQRPDLAKICYWRSKSWMNLFDPSTGHMRPRLNGGWLKPFYPEEINNHFTEGNSWHYSFYVPQDVEGLVRLHGGKAAFERKLDQLFNSSSKTRGREQADVTGLIGQYAHGNEPSHHMAYLYNYTDAPQKTRDYTRKILNAFYRNAPDGLIGNEDCGQMSAWYVFSALGLYPLCPGSNEYALSSPLYSSYTLQLPAHPLKVTCDASLGQGFATVVLSNAQKRQGFITHKELLSTGSLRFQTGDAESAKQASPAFSQSNLYLEQSYIPAPIIEYTARIFKDSTRVSVEALQGKDLELGLLMDAASDKTYLAYQRPLWIKDTRTIAVIATGPNGHSSAPLLCKLNKISHSYSIQISGRVNAQYAANGPASLLDGIVGDRNWRKGDWLGYQGQDIDIEVDLGKTGTVAGVSLNALQDQGSWIFFPASVDFYAAGSDREFALLEQVPCASKEPGDWISTHSFRCNKPVTCRYLKLKVKGYGKLPEGHPGAGGESFFFLDELQIQAEQGTK